MKRDAVELAYGVPLIPGRIIPRLRLRVVEFLFWGCLAVLTWTYAGYPALIMIRARSRVASASPMAVRGVKVTAVVAVRNGAPWLAPRVENLLEQAYPPELLDVVVVLNGCTDATTAVAAELEERSPRVRVLESPPEQGKAGALNHGVDAAAGEVIVFADVRQSFRPEAVERLVNAVMQRGMGAVSGRLVIGTGGRSAVRGMARYWSFETALRRAESATGSVMGVTGAIYAVRREVFRPIPPGTILDDVYEPLRIALDGHRVGLEPAAVAIDDPSADQVSEYRRRVRTLLGNLQLVRLLPELLNPRRNPLFFRFMSHKLLRVLSPLLLLGVLASGLAIGHGIYLVVALGELALIGLGLLGMLIHVPLLALPAAFLMIQIAALEAMFRRRRAATDVWTK